MQYFNLQISFTEEGTDIEKLSYLFKVGGLFDGEAMVYTQNWSVSPYLTQLYLTDHFIIYISLYI
jgi:hypothetical protein